MLLCRWIKVIYDNRTEFANLKIIKNQKFISYIIR